MIARVRRGTRDPPWPWAPPWRTFRKGRALFDALSRTDPTLYVIFFVLAGADLNLALLES